MILVKKGLDSIKKYLSFPLVLGAPIKGMPLILYNTVHNQSLGIMRAQEIEERKEISLCYRSQTFVGAKMNYSPMEKMPRLVLVIQKLKYQMYAHIVCLCYFQS